MDYCEIALACILAGETLGCPILMTLAVAYVYQNNSTMYGWSDNPSQEVMFITRNWGNLPDASINGLYFFSESDLKQQRVQRIVNPPNAPPLSVSISEECNNGSTVYVFNNQGRTLSDSEKTKMKLNICRLAETQGYRFEECKFYSTMMFLEKVFEDKLNNIEKEIK